MNRLPKLKWQGLAWSLPLSRQTRELLASLLIRSGEGHAEVARLADQLRQDPALFLFAALWRPLDNRATVRDLACQLWNALPGVLAAGEGFEPSAARPDSTAADCTVLNKLGRRFARMPIERWLSAGDAWLELVGPAVPVAWRETWPQIDDPRTDDESGLVAATSRQLLGQNTGETPDYRPGELDLSRLARQTAQLIDWERRFERAVETSKRAAVQQFAYGLSHEINNPLANISTRAQLLMKDEPDALRRRGMERIVEQAMRAHEMIADLMFYARPPQPVFGEVDPRAMLATVIRDSSAMVRDRGIELRLVEGPPSLRVRADYCMLLEATRALVRNAIEAIAADGRVVLSYETSPGAEGLATADDFGTVPAQLLIRIADSGPGLSEAASRNALDPYFSGREAGRGLGVGLCRAARIAELHGGRLTLSTGPIGCTASLQIPLGR